MRKRFLPLALAGVAIAMAGATPGAEAQPASAVYTTPGGHLVNGRYWKTDCEKYSSNVIRCHTQIWATKITREGNHFVHRQQWVFNNLTYLPAPRATWSGNNLARTTQWTGADGRTWRTECDTATTGRNGCRTYVSATVLEKHGNRHVNKQKMVFNNMVLFSTGAQPHITSIPAAAPKIWLPTQTKVVATYPVSGTSRNASRPAQNTGSVKTTGATGSCKASYYWQGQRTANGERFNPNGFTTAHRSFPFGTRLKVTNPANGKSVIVRVNDRGPFIKGRCLDLSRAAMKQIGGTSAGVINVTYQRVS